MIIGENRTAVIQNIKAAAQAGDFHRKVEVNDPVLTDREERDIVERWQNRGAMGKFKMCLARKTANIVSRLLNRDTRIEGMEKLAGITGGAILTCNHFSPLDNTVPRLLALKMGKKRLNILSQLTNFAMKGPVGFLMNYADTVPLWEEPAYLLKTLPRQLARLTEKGQWVLIYPEKEMWFHYRKPREGLRGAYHFAAQLNVPVVSCFVEMRDRETMDNDQFRKVKYTLHILEVMYPDPEKTLRENSRGMCARDYALRKAAYERIYGKPLTWDFDPTDIAGWCGEEPAGNARKGDTASAGDQ